MSKAPKKACKGCTYCIPHYGNVDKSGKKTVSRYWCMKKSMTCNDPKICELREGK